MKNVILKIINKLSSKFNDLYYSLISTICPTGMIKKQLTSIFQLRQHEIIKEGRKIVTFAFLFFVIFFFFCSNIFTNKKYSLTNNTETEDSCLKISLQQNHRMPMTNDQHLVWKEWYSTKSTAKNKNKHKLDSLVSTYIKQEDTGGLKGINTTSTDGKNVEFFYSKVLQGPFSRVNFSNHSAKIFSKAIPR